jgi:hypothetical protein
MVEAGRPHNAYKEELRRDFCFACAYCTMTELEATAIGYEIDHYQPQSKAGSDAYANLYWACEPCNQKKKGYWPTPTEADAGHRILRVDLENPELHVTTDVDDSTRVSSITELGKFNIEFLGLNFPRMTRLRKIRADAGYSANLIRQGFRALLTMRLDELPQGLKARASKINEDLRRSAETVEMAVDDALRRLAEESSKAELLDMDDAAASRERRAYLESIGRLKTRNVSKKKR